MKEDVAMRWITKAENDLKAVKHLLTFEDAPTDPSALLYEVKGQMTPVAAWKRLRYASATTAPHREQGEETAGWVSGGKRTVKRRGEKRRCANEVV